MSPPVLSVFNSAPRLVGKAPGTARWCVWVRTKVTRFTACTVTWAHGLWIARAVACSPASMSGSQENGQRYSPGDSGSAFRSAMAWGQQSDEGRNVGDSHPPASSIPENWEPSNKSLSPPGPESYRCRVGGGVHKIVSTLLSTLRPVIPFNVLIVWLEMNSYRHCKFICFL